MNATKYAKHGVVLVGVGDGEPNTRALDWAAQDAILRKTSLILVRAFHWTSLAPWDWNADRQITSELHALAQNRVEHALRHVRDAFPDLDARGEAVDGIAWEVMLEHSASAAVTVLGSRRLGVLGAALLGSVSTVVAARAESPVVVIEGAPGLAPEDPATVVGVDGSEEAEHALAFGFEHASRRGRPLVAVFCWPRDALAQARWRSAPPAPDRAERWLAEALTGWQEKYPDVTVRRQVVRDNAVSGLVRASLAQDLLVVGARAHHARAAALLGSVSQGVLHHALCPVAVVH